MTSVEWSVYISFYDDYIVELWIIAGIDFYLLSMSNAYSPWSWRLRPWDCIPFIIIASVLKRNFLNGKSELNSNYVSVFISAIRNKKLMNFPSLGDECGIRDNWLQEFSFVPSILAHRQWTNRQMNFSRKWYEQEPGLRVSIEYIFLAGIMNEDTIYLLCMRIIFQFQVFNNNNIRSHCEQRRKASIIYLAAISSKANKSNEMKKHKKPLEMRGTEKRVKKCYYNLIDKKRRNPWNEWYREFKSNHFSQ